MDDQRDYAEEDYNRRTMREDEESKMDPNAALNELRFLLSSTTADPATQLEMVTEKFEALDEWLIKGGFLPAAWSGAR